MQTQGRPIEKYQEYAEKAACVRDMDFFVYQAIVQAMKQYDEKTLRTFLTQLVHSHLAGAHHQEKRIRKRMRQGAWIYAQAVRDLDGK